MTVKDTLAKLGKSILSRIPQKFELYTLIANEFQLNHKLIQRMVTGKQGSKLKSIWVTLSVISKIQKDYREAIEELNDYKIEILNAGIEEANSDFKLAEGIEELNRYKNRISKSLKQASEPRFQISESFLINKLLQDLIA